MANKLLRDAIADAKAVRETALAHAKAALEEAFTPHITSMLSARLRNEAEDYENDEDQDKVDELNDPVSGDGHGSEDGGETDVDAVQSSSHTGDQNVTEDVDDNVDSDAEGLKSSEIGTEPTQKYGTSSPRDPASGASAKTSSGDTDNEGLMQPAGTKVSEGIFEDDDEIDPELAALGGEEGEGEEEEPDLDLEAIIAELEADMVQEMGDDEYETTDELPDEDEPVMEQNDAEVSDGHGPGEGGEKDASVTAKSTFTQGTGDKQTDPITEQEDDDEKKGEGEEELDLDEILREIETEETQGSLQAENARMTAELKEYQVAVKFLRSKLNEVNLLNSKLLYTNRLFKDYSMSGRQKMRVVESFDRATNVREAKLVYTTLAETFRGKPVTRKRRQVTEGFASKATGTKTPNDATRPGRATVLAEGEDLVARFKKLAGITKS